MVGKDRYLWQYSIPSIIVLCKKVAVGSLWPSRSEAHFALGTSLGLGNSRTPYLNNFLVVFCAVVVPLIVCGA
jgi:hypothetical protein